MTSKLLQFLGFPSRERHPDFAKVFWLIKLRWMLIGVFFILSLSLFAMDHLQGTQLPPLMGVIGILSLFNLLTQLFASENKSSTSALGLCFQLGVDVCVFTGLLFLIEGLSSPLVVGFLLFALLGGWLIPSRLALPFLFLIHSLLAFSQVKAYEALSFLDREPRTFLVEVVAYHFLLFLFWVVARSLGTHLEYEAASRHQTQIRLERQDRLRAVGALTSGFSHELSSPLNTVKIRMDRLGRSNLTDDQKKEICVAQRALEDCELVLRQMNSSQLDTRDFHKQELSLSSLLREIIEAWSKDHPTAKIQSQIEEVGFVRLAPLNFAQAVLNLLDNAYEATPEGCIHVQLQKNSQSFHLSIEDQGPGFSPQIFSQLGEPFNTNKTEGTGLGLYVSELFVQSLGGELKVLNLPEKGARVSLIWPDILGVRT